MADFPPFRLDKENQSLWRDGQRIPLTPKAFAILDYLVTNAGRLVTQQELFESLWPDTYVQPEVLKTHIRDVRTALGDTAKNSQFIETLHRRGYRFIAPVYENHAAIELPATPDSAKSLIGIEENLSTLSGYLQTACTGQRQIVFVAGEVGIGKTSLVKAFEHEARRTTAGLRIVQGQCIEGYGSREPYYAVLEAISDLLHQPGKEEVIRVLTSLAPTWMVQFPGLIPSEERELLNQEVIGSSRERMLREICDALETIAQKIPLLMILEDVHWSDPYTADWFSALAHSNRAARIMIVATVRPVELSLSGHPLRPLRQRLLAHRLCYEVAVKPLTEGEVARFLKTKSCDSAVLPDLAKLIYQQSEGNPLFMKATLDHLIVRELLSCKDGVWTTKVSLDKIRLVVPETLRQMLEAHIEFCLSESEQRALEAASISGVSFLAAVISDAAGLDQEELEKICDRLARREHFIEAEGVSELPNGRKSPRYRFLHAFYREVLYRLLPLSRRIKLHKRIAEILEHLFQNNYSEISPQLAYHFEESSDWQKASKYLLLVSEKEVQQFAYRDAARVLEHALKLVLKSPLEEVKPLEIEILEKLAATLSLMDDFSRAVEVLQTIISIANLANNSAIEARALIRLAFMLCRSDANACMDVVDRALQLNKYETDPIRHAEIRMGSFLWRIAARGWNHDYAEECTAAGEEILQNADPVIRARYQVEYGLIQFLSSYYRDGLLNEESGIPVLIRERDIEYRGGQLVSIWQMLFLGDWGKALSKVHRLISTAQKDGNLARASIWQMQLAWIHEQLMNPIGVLDLSNPASPLLQNPAMEFFRRQSLILTGAAEVCLGKFDQARHHLTLAKKLMDEHSVFIDWYWRIPLQLAFTDLALSNGNIPEARNEAKELLTISLATEERTWQALAWEANARVALAKSNLSDARKFLNNAILALEGFEAPLAHWRVHHTAIRVFPKKTEHHRQQSIATTLNLAASLKDFSELREKFLSSEKIRQVLGKIVA